MSRRVARWLWQGGTPGSRLARAVLLPAAGVYGVGMAARAYAYAQGWRRTHRLALPAVAVGNLAVGGTGKTPVASWIAAYSLARGVRPGILLRGYGGDEPLVHEHLTPGAVVVADPDRRAGARRARAAGAEVLVLDDAFQRLDVARDLDLALLAAEHDGLAPWPLPAGPWREGWRALRRATAVVVTRKRATAAAAVAVATRVGARAPGVPMAIAHLRLTGLAGLRTGGQAATAALSGRRVVAACGIGDPESFAAQLRAFGAQVDLVAFPDHHAYRAGDLSRLVQAAAAADYLIVTEKDAVKLRHHWPVAAREPLVALLSVEWERGGDVIHAQLDALLERARRSAEDL